ncbi:GxxExxY protein [Wenzhouxiangella sp. AB-CW3]|uniref:GxxExxY protein n=1 Tax=Wenzhouxiangella sp. AB-CW3 TaxID=2771012 RepID=UPI00168AE6F1|nr:GxxExxY protein [Wenzhouxiangella sp. AB-CW3]QOC21241.1 GxxExxY protein [Wenzhouxiangella sp. AB-CW3]
MNADLNQVSEQIIGCVYNVSNGLGSGFLESVYENALAIEFGRQELSYRRQAEVNVRYDGHVVGAFVTDFIVENSVVVELKAVSTLLPEHQAQLLNYLRCGSFRLGLLVNFGQSKAQIKRMVHQL